LDQMNFYFKFLGIHMNFFESFKYKWLDGHQDHKEKLFKKIIYMHVYKSNFENTMVGF
jgi:hypothetical protein